MGPIGASVSGAYWAQHVLGTSNASHRMLAGGSRLWCWAGGRCSPKQVMAIAQSPPSSTLRWLFILLLCTLQKLIWIPYKYKYKRYKYKYKRTGAVFCTIIPIQSVLADSSSSLSNYSDVPSRPPRYLIHLPTYLAGYLICTTWYYLCTYQPTYLVTYAPSYAPNRWWLLHNLLHPLCAMLAHPPALCSTIMRSL